VRAASKRRDQREMPLAMLSGLDEAPLNQRGQVRNRVASADDDPRITEQAVFLL
jgi:hypothetical protein